MHTDLSFRLNSCIIDNLHRYFMYCNWKCSYILNSNIFFINRGLSCIHVCVILNDCTTNVLFGSIFTDTPFGQLPVLHINNRELCQSRAIEHYLARQFGKNLDWLCFSIIK